MLKDINNIVLKVDDYDTFFLAVPAYLNYFGRFQFVEEVAITRIMDGKVDAENIETGEEYEDIPFAFLFSKRSEAKEYIKSRTEAELKKLQEIENIRVLFKIFSGEIKNPISKEVFYGKYLKDILIKEMNRREGL